MRNPPLILVGLVSSLCQAAQPPNLIIILTDDHGYHDVGFNGCTDIATPHLDSLAENGIRFTEGYVSNPICGPSRAGLLTGRYQDRFGFTANPTEDPINPTVGIPHEEENIAEVLKKVGFTSSIVGKWHMGAHIDHHPLNRGFDHFFGFLSGGHNYFPDLLTLNDLTDVDSEWGWYSTRILHNHEPVDIHDYLTDELTDAANAFIDDHARSDSPFFLYLAYNAPHGPMQATKKYLRRFPHITNERRRTYAAMLSAVDDGVGRVLDNLRFHSIENNTLVVFLSDNGGPLDNGSSNFPLRGKKGQVFDGGLRVPFAMQWKGKLPAGKVYTHPVISLDIMATISELAGAPTSDERPLDGVNLIPFLTDETKGEPHEQLFWRKLKQNIMAIRQGDMKLISMAWQKNSSHQLFDLGSDPSETLDISNTDQKITIDALKLKWLEWNTQLKDECIFPTNDTWWERNSNVEQFIINSQSSQKTLAPQH